VNFAKQHEEESNHKSKTMGRQTTVRENDISTIAAKQASTAVAPALLLFALPGMVAGTTCQVVAVASTSAVFTAIITAG